MKLSRSVIVIVMVIVGVGATLPTAALAAPSFPYWGPLVSCGPGTGGAQTCTSLCDLLYTGQNVLYFAMSVALLILGPVMIVVGGLMIATSAGSEERIKTGRKVITGAVIGVFIMLAAYVIISSFLSAVGANVGTGTDQVPWPNISCRPPANPSTNIREASEPSQSSQNQGSAGSGDGSSGLFVPGGGRSGGGGASGSWGP